MAEPGILRIPPNFFHPSEKLATALFNVSYYSGENAVDNDDMPPYRHRLDVTPDWFPEDFRSPPDIPHAIESISIRIFRLLSTLARRASTTRADTILISENGALREDFASELRSRLHIEANDRAAALLNIQLRKEMQDWLGHLPLHRYFGPRWRVSLNHREDLLLIAEQGPIQREL